MSGSKFVYVTYIRTTPEKLWHALTKAAVRQFHARARGQLESEGPIDTALTV